MKKVYKKPTLVADEIASAQTILWASWDKPQPGKGTSARKKLFGW